MSGSGSKPVVGNWGRWGEDDERGALNTLTPAATVRAAGLVRDGKVYSLAQQIAGGMLAPSHRPSITHFMNRDGGDYAAGGRQPGGFQFAEDTIVMPLHTGTHIDALCHCWYDDALFNGHSGNEVRSTGSRRMGVEKIGAIVSRGVLLDFVALNGGPLADGTEITADMLEAAIRASGTELLTGDVVLLRTGWMEAQKPDTPPNFYAEPGLGLEAARILAMAGCALIGADNFAVEVLPFPKGTVFQVHQCLIRDFGIPLIEGLVLTELAKSGASTFLFALGTLPIVGATGCPVMPIAVT